LEWVQAFAFQYADPEAEASVRTLLRQRDSGQVTADLQRDFAGLLNVAPPDLGGFHRSGPLQHALQLIVGWETLSREELLSGLGAAVAGMQWFCERHWPGSTQPHRLTAAVADAKPDLAHFQRLGSPPAGIGPLTVVPTIHLHLLFKSYRLFCTDLGTLRAQANLYARYLLAWVEALQARAGKVPDAAAPGSGASFEQSEVAKGSTQKTARPVDQVTERLAAIARAWRRGRAEDSVRQAFSRVLERPVDEPSLRAYAAHLAGGMTERQLVRELVLSEEHLHYFIKILNPFEGVHKLYDHILARPSDPHGLEYCLSKLQSFGAEAGAESLLQSDEYTERFGDYKVPGDGRPGCY
jgi:hypothetical protein